MSSLRKQLHTGDMDFRRKIDTKTLEKKKMFQKEKSLPTYVPPIQDSKTCVVRLKKIDGKTYQDCDVYIGPKMNNSSWELDESPWVNIFHYATSDRTNNLKLYREHVMNTPALRNQLYELRGKRLGCFCENLSFCHGTVLCKLVEEDSQTKEIKAQHNYFFKGEENPLSNLYKCTIKYGGTDYFCSEHFRCMKMAQRLQSRTEIMEQVKKATTIQEVCRLSKAIFRTLKRCRLYTPSEQIVDMINTLNEKWYACEEFREKLKSLNDGMLIFEATRNNFWGCGKDITEITEYEDIVQYEGENILGWALYYVRAKFEEKAKEMQRRLNTFKKLDAIDEIDTEQIKLIQAEKKCMEHRLLKPEPVLGLPLPSEEEKEESQRLRRDRMLKSDKGLQNLVFDYGCFNKSEEQCSVAKGLKKVIDAVTEHVSEVNIFLF